MCPETGGAVGTWIALMQGVPSGDRHPDEAGTTWSATLEGMCTTYILPPDNTLDERPHGNYIVKGQLASFIVDSGALGVLQVMGAHRSRARPTLPPHLRLGTRPIQCWPIYLRFSIERCLRAKKRKTLETSWQLLWCMFTAYLSCGL